MAAARGQIQEVGLAVQRDIKGVGFAIQEVGNAVRQNQDILLNNRKCYLTCKLVL